MTKICRQVDYCSLTTHGCSATYIDVLQVDKAGADCIVYNDGCKQFKLFFEMIRDSTQGRWEIRKRKKDMDTFSFHELIKYVY